MSEEDLRGSWVDSAGLDGRQTLGTGQKEGRRSPQSGRNIRLPAQAEQEGEGEIGGACERGLFRDRID